MRNLFATKKGAAVSAGMRAKAASGFVVGAARIGYVAVRTERGVSTAPDSVTASILRETFLMARGGTPVHSIAACLRERKVCGKRGEPVSLATVPRILTDSYYCGMIQDGAGRWVAGRHEETVGQELFALVRRELLLRRCCPAKAKWGISSR